jgi:hypothetical protein
MSAAVVLDSHTVWWIALGIGLVVIVVVVALMALLLSFIADIDRGAVELLGTAGQIRQQTSSIRLLGQTHAALEEIKEEAVIHLGYLEGQVG